MKAKVYVEFARPFTLVAPALGFISGALTAVGAHPRQEWSLAVITPGHIERGDTIHHTWRSPHGLTIPELVDLYVGDAPPVDRLRIAAAIPELSESWRTRFQERLAAQE
mgnify:CR=1 FL=1